MDSRHAVLGVDDHFSEQIGETGTAELGGAGAVQVAVVDCLAVGGCSEAGVGCGALLGGGLGVRVWREGLRARSEDHGCGMGVGMGVSWRLFAGFYCDCGGDQYYGTYGMRIFREDNPRTVLF